MAKYLITGARAPVALELARNLANHGHQVIAADSLSYPLTRFSRCIERYVRLPSPHKGLEVYSDFLLDIIKQNSIDILLPTCEEVFFISRSKLKLEPFCQVLCPDFELISQLHSKLDILNLSRDMGVHIPATQKLGSHRPDQNADFSNKVVKPEYTRFGTNLLIKPNSEQVKKLMDLDVSPVLQQEMVSGIEICTYSLAVEGKLKLHLSYRPEYRAGNSAGIYFSLEVNREITEFVQRFVKKYRYSGQIGFDFIQSGGAIFLIECNPRATSGLHLANNIDIDACINSPSTALDCTDSQPACIGIAMLLYSLDSLFSWDDLKNRWCAYERSREIIYSKSDRAPALMQMLPIIELAIRALNQSMSLRAMTTKDIEWNGGDML